MKPDGLARSRDLITDDPAHGPALAPDVAPHVRPLGGRRISLIAWSLAGVAGIAMWTLIIRLI
jgi:hypothetical protein